MDYFDDILAFEKELKDAGFYYRPDAGIGNQLLFVCGNYYDGSGDLQTHFIHVVLTDSMDWINYINFRDYLNNYRITEAASQLVNTDKKISQIAEEVGYHDLDYFVNRFIAIKGCTPAKFRKQNS